MVEDDGVAGDEFDGGALDEGDAGEDGALEVDQFGALAGDEVDDAVDVALLVELIGRDADELGALLPGEVVLAGDAGEALGLDGVEDAIADGEEDVDGGEGTAPPE